LYAPDSFFVPVNDELRSDFPGVRVSKLDHLWEFITGVNMQERKRILPGRKPFAPGAALPRILADGIQHYRTREFRNGLSQYVNALRFERLQMVQPPPLRALARGPPLGEIDLC